MTDAPDAVATAPGIDPGVLQRRASDPTASVWVGASAGTGKTKVLADRVLRLMLPGHDRAATPPQRILCLTFTKAAAAEMANRIRDTLAAWAILPDDTLEDRLADLLGARPDSETRTAARQLFARVIDCPGGMKILTIHAFCQSLLRRFPLEVGLPPHFEAMDDRTANELLAAARQEMLQSARDEPESVLGQAVARLAGTLAADEFAALMAELARERTRVRRILDHHDGHAATIAALRRYLRLEPGEDAATLLAAACRDDAFDAGGLRTACRALATGSDTDRERGRTLQAWLDDAGERVAGFAKYQKLFLTEDDEPRKVLLTQRPAADFAGALDALKAEQARLAVLLERRNTAEIAGSTTALLVVAQSLLATYERIKASRSLLDYDDLILCACDLLERPGVADWVLFKLDGGLDHILIDEAQDTNPEQWRVVAALAAEFFTGEGARKVPRTVFAVGDEKQSIFSFQRADLAEFARMRQHFADRTAAARGTWQQVDLAISFRSTRAVLGTVDAVFEPAAARAGVAFDAEAPLRHVAFRRGHAGRVELWPPVSPAAPPDSAAWEPPLQRVPGDDPQARLAAIIAETIRRWIAEEEPLEARGRPIHAGDVMVLVRRRTRFVECLVRALKERRVPVAGVDRMVLATQLSVMDLMALARFLLLPEDDLTLATVLKGPLIGLGEEALFELAHRRAGHLWPALVARAAGDAAFRPTHDYLGRLLGRTDYQAPYELFAGLLGAPCPGDAVSGRRALLARLGKDAQDPIDEFLAACLAFERTHVPSLQGFLHWLEIGEAEIKRELDRGGGRVRILTVHGAKGLQAPIVFLPDTMGVPKQRQALLWPDGERTVPLYAPRRALETSAWAAARARAEQRRDEEHRRLLYVALTRAEDRLYVCGWHGKQGPANGCWHGLVERALERVGERAELDPTRLGPMGWSGSGWRLVDRQLAPPKDDNAGRPGPADHGEPPAFARAPAPPEPEPARPLSPSRPEVADPAMRSPIGADDGARFRRGLLVHRLLQTLPDLPAEARPAAARRFLARPAHRLPDDAAAAIAAETLALLDHPGFAPLFGPGSRAEVPVVGVVGGWALSGKVDRLLVTDEAVFVVDYKTNRPPPTRVEEVAPVYLKQMAAYRTALARLYPGRAIRCLLLWTDGARAMELPSALLDAHAPGTMALPRQAP